MGIVEWKKTELCDGNISVSSNGDVRNDKTGTIYRQYVNDNGYCIVGLYDKTKKSSKHYRVHRIVANAFFPNPYDKCDVNHIDGNKQNNRVENLEWTTRSENIIHAFTIGLRKTTEVQRASARKNILKNREFSNLNRKEIFSIDSNGVITYYDSIKTASDSIGVTKAAICHCLKDEKKNCKGMKWRYKYANQFEK